MIRAAGIFAVFGAFWWALGEITSGRVWGLFLGDPVAPVFWLLAALPFIMAACVFIPERLRTIREVVEVPTEVHNHIHVHNHNHVTVNYTDQSQHVHIDAGEASRVYRDLDRAARQAVGGGRRDELAGAQPRIVPGEVIPNRAIA